MAAIDERTERGLGELAVDLDLPAPERGLRCVVLAPPEVAG